MDVAVFGDAADFLIADWNNHKVRRVTDGAVETILGTMFLGDGDPDFEEREPPGVDGTTVALNHPTSMEWNPATGRWLLPSWHNHRLRQWSPDTGLSLVVGASIDTASSGGRLTHPLRRMADFALLPPPSALRFICARLHSSTHLWSRPVSRVQQCWVRRGSTPR